MLSYVETVGLASFIAASERLARLHGERFEAPQSLRERAHGDRKFHDTVTQENRP